jgi:hypothetical protein
MADIAIECAANWYRRSAGALLVALVLSTAGVTPALGQCVGDCDANGRVGISELVTGVNIALGSSQITACPVFDKNDNGRVDVSELVLGVNNALGGCPTGNPTPTPTETPETGTPTETPVVNPSCGNGVIEPDLGENCDDGPDVGKPGDNCPADCSINPCQHTASTLDADVVIQGPSETLFGTLQVFVIYPDGDVELPSSGSQAMVAISNLPDDAFSTSVNDVDWGVQVLSVGPDGLTLGSTPANRFFTAQFSLCEGATAPPPAAFSCIVVNATAVDGTPLTDQTTCSVSVP